METGNIDSKKQGLFAQCSLVIVRDPGLDDAKAQELRRYIKVHDGEVVIHDCSECPLSLTGITHIISQTSDFPEYEAAYDALIPVVRPTWIEHSIARNRLAHVRQYNPHPRMFMSEVVACCVDLPEGDAEAIAGGILAMGGLYSSKITSQTTHIVALSIDSEPCDSVMRKNMNIKIVLPHWFDDCLKLGRRIDEHPYLLPNPEIMQGPQDRAPAGGQKGQINGAINPDPSSTPPPSPAATRNGQKVFKKKKVMLCKDLRIGSHLLGVIDGIIVSGGGKITTSVDQADLFICKYREGEDYRTASRAGKHVGNLAWLYHLIATDTWTSPWRRLLHYPISREPVPGFQNLKISLSNYSGEARTYLENLIIATGAECTKTLKQDNTHLVTAHTLSEKCAAAKDWGVHVVNHLWVEESYARWRMESITNSRYTHFPSRTNLGEVVGFTQFDRDVIEQRFYSGEDVDLTNSRTTDGTNVPNHEVPMKTLDQNTVSGPDDKPEEGKNARRIAARASDRQNQATPAVRKILDLDKENLTPLSTGSRRSKDVAAAKLHNLSDDIALYEKEKKRVGGVVYGGRQKSEDGKASPTRKRTAEEASDGEDAETNDKKKARKGPPQATMHLLVSGYKKWVGHPKVEDSDKKQLRNLGIIVTLDPARASHLAAPSIVRTHKFVSAIAYAPTILSTKFIDACLEADDHLDPDKFELHDKENEKKIGFSLKLSKERAKENRNNLLAGRSIYCIENIHGGFETFRSIVEANGGQCMLWRNRKGTLVPSKRAETDSGQVDDAQNEVYLLSGPLKDNEKLWERFKQMAESSRKTPRIVNSDWLLETAMSQKLLSTTKYEVSTS